MLKVTANSSGYGQVAQWIENVRTAAGQSLTVSFWAKSPNAGPLRFHIYQNFGSGGSSNVSIVDDNNYFTINQADTWQRFEATVEIPSVSGKTIGASSYLAVQTGAPSAIANRVVYYSEFQAELGKVATPFEHRSYGEELALCQRYFRQINSSSAEINIIGSGLWDNSTNARVIVHHPVEMRTAPTYTASSAGHLVAGESGVTWRTGTGTSQIYTRDGFSSLIRVDIASSGATTGEGAFVGLNSGSGYYVRFDAEL
jgi:hypothetical protein